MFKVSLRPPQILPLTLKRTPFRLVYRGAKVTSRTSICFAKLGTKGHQKSKPTNITLNEFFAYNLRVAARLSLKSSGEHAEALSEYLDYQEILTTMRCNYSDESVLKFDDDFRRTTASRKLPLNDEQVRKLFADKYFHAACRKVDKGQTSNNSKTQLFRGKGHGLQQGGRGRYKFPCCFNFQDNKCSRTAAKCSYKHVCGECNGEHRAIACPNRHI